MNSSGDLANLSFRPDPQRQQESPKVMMDFLFNPSSIAEVERAKELIDKEFDMKRFLKSIEGSK